MSVFTEKNKLRRQCRNMSRTRQVYAVGRWWRQQFDGTFGRENNPVTYNNCVIGTSGSVRDETPREKR
jgi:hypothetical protein